MGDHAKRRARQAVLSHRLPGVRRIEVVSATVFVAGFLRASAMGLELRAGLLASTSPASVEVIPAASRRESKCLVFIG